MKQLTLADLHDAVLESILLDWAAGGVSFHLRVGGAHSGAWELRAEEVALISVPRGKPCGPSSSIMGVEIAKLDTRLDLRLAMQSGDEIAVQCTSYPKIIAYVTGAQCAYSITARPAQT